MPMTIAVGSGSSPPKSVNILAKVGMMKMSMKAVAPTRHDQHDRRVDHGALDLALAARRPSRCRWRGA